MTQMLLSETYIGLYILSREVLEQKGYDMVEVAHSYAESQAAVVALLEGVTLDIRYLIVW